MNFQQSKSPLGLIKAWSSGQDFYKGAILDLNKAEKIEDLDHENTARLVLDMFHRIIIHYALWFNEVKHQMGMEKALDILKKHLKEVMTFK